jgi:hypothetical protein
VAHTCNPSYSGGRNQEDHGLKPDRANNSTRPYVDKGLMKWLKEEALSSNSGTTKKKKKTQN